MENLKIYSGKGGGGDVVNSPNSIRRLPAILKKEMLGDINFFTVSAIGGITNKLEGVLFSYYENDTEALISKLSEIEKVHSDFAEDLLPRNALIATLIHMEVEKIKTFLTTTVPGTLDEDLVYSKVVSLGEILSALIIKMYLNDCRMQCEYLDAREAIVTHGYKNAVVDIETTSKKLWSYVKSLKPTNKRSLVVIGGFIGSTSNGETSTLGREGSDLTAAVIARVLTAQKLLYFKKFALHDKDPQRFKKAKFLPQVSLEYLQWLVDTESIKAIFHRKTLLNLIDFKGEIEIIEYANPDNRTIVIK
jgi:aspartate kinase